jgi:hypothetical protein
MLRAKHHNSKPTAPLSAGVFLQRPREGGAVFLWKRGEKEKTEDC